MKILIAILILQLGFIIGVLAEEIAIYKTCMNAHQIKFDWDSNITCEPIDED